MGGRAGHMHANCTSCKPWLLKLLPWMLMRCTCHSFGPHAYCHKRSRHVADMSSLYGLCNMFARDTNQARYVVYTTISCLDVSLAPCCTSRISLTCSTCFATLPHQSILAGTLVCKHVSRSLVLLMSCSRNQQLHTHVREVARAHKLDWPAEHFVEV